MHFLVRIILMHMRCHRSWLYSLLILLITLGFPFLVFSDHPIDADEGAVLNAAWNLWNGKIMYVDFWEYVPPGSAYLTYWTWKLGGEATYLYAKCAAIIFWILSALGVVLILKRLRIHAPLIALAVLLWMAACISYPLINYNPFSSFAAIWFLFFIILFIYKPSFRTAAFTGFMAAIVFLILQTKGFLLLAAGVFILFYLNALQLRERIAYLAFFLFCFLLALAPIFALWAPQTLFDYLVLYPFNGNFFGHTSISPTVVFIEIAIVGFVAFRAIHARSRLFACLAIIQTALFVSNSHLIDIPHVAINIFPFIIFLVLRISETALSATSLTKSLKVVLSSLLLFLLLMVTAQRMAGPNMYSYERYDAERTSIFALDALRDAKLIFFGPFMRSMYFEMRKPNPFPETNMLLCNATCQAKIVEILKTQKPEFALLDYKMAERFQYRKEESLVDQYILGEFSYCGKLGKTSVALYSLGACPEYTASVGRGRL